MTQANVPNREAGISSDDATTGRAFLDRLLSERFGPSGTVYRPGDGVLEQIRVYAHPSGHWHYTTYGYSELDEKSWPDADFSGYGMEMTFRLAKADETDAPTWPVDLLEEIATYAFDSRRLINPGDHLLVRSRLAAHLPEYAAVLCSLDPEFGEQASPNGRVDFVQITAIHESELLAVRNGRMYEVLTRLTEDDPLRVTRPGRRPVVEELPT